jgi:hypothetical protein
MCAVGLGKSKLRAPAGEARGLLSRDGVYPKAEELIYGKLRHGAGIRQRCWSVRVLIERELSLGSSSESQAVTFSGVFSPEISPAPGAGLLCVAALLVPDQTSGRISNQTVVLFRPTSFLATLDIKLRTTACRDG